VPPARPGARGELAVAEIDGEAVVYDEALRRLHHLNHSAALVFELCDGRATIVEMAEEIGDVFETDAREVEKLIRPLVGQLRKQGLVEGKVADRLKREADAQQAALGKLRRIPVPQDT
jgi:Coenzyme PQQ synthesis protein D (PqqD)